jgi:hypothetical protein
MAITGYKQQSPKSMTSQGMSALSRGKDLAAIKDALTGRQ